MGIEPTTSAWKAEVLPLNYTRNLLSNALCIWSERQDSNLRPPAPKAVLYQAEPRPEYKGYYIDF